MSRNGHSHGPTTPIVHVTQAKRVLTTLRLLIGVVGSTSILGIILQQAYNEVASLVPPGQRRSSVRVPVSRDA